MASLEGFDPTGGFDSADMQNALGGAGGSISIEQIEGDPRSRRKVIITGRSMPYRLVGWQGSQRTRLTWYPGNPVATQQVLGSEEMPTTMGGMWKDRFIRRTINVNGNLDQIQTAEQAVQLFHGIGRAGRKLRVQWLSEVRAGILKTFTPTYLSANDVEWEFEFEWSSMSDEVAPRAAVALNPASDLLNQMNDLEDLFAMAPGAIERLTARLVTGISNLKDRVAKVFGILRTIEAAINLPAAVLGALRTAVRELRNELLDFAGRLDKGRTSTFETETSTALKFGSVGSFITQRSGIGIPTQGLTTKTSAVALSSPETAELQFEVWRRTMATRARNMAYFAHRKLLEVESRVQPSVASRRVVLQGETLYSIAAQIYGSPDFANHLAAANRLDTALVPAGFELRIPARQFGALELSSSKRQECC